MEVSSDQLKKILVAPGFLSEANFEIARQEALIEKKFLSEVIIDKDLIKDEQLGALIAQELGFNFIDLRKEKISEDVLKIIPGLVAKMQQVIVFEKNNLGLKVAMADPTDYKMIQWLRKKTGLELQIYYATPSAIREALKYYKKELKEEFADIISDQVQQAKEKGAKAQDPPIIKIIDTIIEYAYENRASDIHIEPLKKEILVRYRIDGVLHDAVVLPKDILDSMITRIKVLAKLRTDEHFAAQDGKFQANFEKETFDIRVSIVPVTEGENIVLRLLSEKSRKIVLDELGILDKNLEKIKRAMELSYGMILATGPTGCGKTTTLYAILKILNKPEVKISTIEDPVEYELEGVAQIQVNPKTNLTFAQGLRSIVRQDPDIIMVGEIRDSETAKIAINSAMTGHLVLSTMHANTAATNLPRLIDMGVEPFLVASSVNIIIAQRLVRKICTKCVETYTPTNSEIEKITYQLGAKRAAEILHKMRFYRGKGCKDCNQTGYLGRIGIFEVMELEDNIKNSIMEKANSDQIEDLAVKNGMSIMLQDGLEKVFRGITSIDEILRAIRE